MITFEDNEWFAIDNDGNIAIFCTNGQGDTPDEILYVELSDWLDSLPFINDAPKSSKNVPNDYWLDIARKGLFAYDYSNDYTKVAEPIIPLKFENSNLFIDDLITFNLNFNDTNTIEDIDFIL